MIVEIVDYGEESEKYFSEYCISGLSLDQIEFLNENLSEQTEICGDIFKLKMYFDENMYPFQSEVAKIRMDDFIAREEIEMNIFISSFLEDM